MDISLALNFGAALGLGILLGLERQRTHGNEAFAGVRTFALITLMGATAAYAHRAIDSAWLAAGAFVALAALVIVSYFVTAQRGDVGITTEVLALLAFLIGALCGWAQVGLAAAVTVASVLLLTLKDWLHNLARRLESADVEATLKFAIITLVVLPLLPNQNYGPTGLEVINPYKIWLMVVLISGLNFISYILVKVVGSEHGLSLTGLLGGLVSSTAVTLGFSQRSKTQPALASAFALGILLAWTVMFFRVVAEVAVVNPALAARLALGVGLMAVMSALISFVLWRRGSSSEKGSVKSGGNPFELGEAIKFGLLFGVITFAAKAAQVYLGEAGLYLAGALAGLTDVDAIALSMANLALADPASAGAAARTILIAILSNTLVKSGMVVSLAAPSLRRVMLPSAALLVGAGGAALFLVG